MTWGVTWIAVHAEILYDTFPAPGLLLNYTISISLLRTTYFDYVFVHIYFHVFEVARSAGIKQSALSPFLHHLVEVSRSGHIFSFKLCNSEFPSVLLIIIFSLLLISIQYHIACISSHKSGPNVYFSPLTSSQFSPSLARSGCSTLRSRLPGVTTCLYRLCHPFVPAVEPPLTLCPMALNQDINLVMSNDKQTS